MKEIENWCIRTQSRTKEFWRLCRYSWNLKTSSRWETSSKRQRKCPFNESGMRLHILSCWMTQYIELSNQTLLNQRPYPVSRFTNNFKHTGGTSEAGRGLTMTAAHQALSQHVRHCSAHFPLGISKNWMWLRNFHRKEWVWFWSISTLYSGSFIVTKEIRAPCIHKFPYLFTTNNPKRPAKPGTSAESTPEIRIPC